MGHVAVGLILGRAYDARTTRERVVTMAAFGGLGLLPDADVLGMQFGISHDSFYGHRGYSHSLLFATVVSLAAWAIARRACARPLFTTLLVFLAVASHGLLDAMTWRTRGIPFLWPFTELRVAFPWRPIPPAPTGVAFLSRRGLEVLAVELVYFGPLIALACAPALTWWQRLAARLAFWRQALPGALATPALSPARPWSAKLAAVHVAAIIAVIAGSLSIAQASLRHSRVVAWIERQTQDNVAVSLAARRPNRQARQ